MSGSPNFVVIMTDDQGAWARGRTMPELITPTLDRLGETGREFTRFFCASPVCSPARASLLTGRMPSAHGVHDWIRCENDGIDTRGVHYLEHRRTLPELLAEAGYHCAHSGKWHLGDAREAAPGFDPRMWFAHLHGGGPYYGAPVSENGEVRTEPGYITDAISDHAVEHLTALAAGDEPFYLQVNYTAPHTPWDAEHHPERLRALYADCTFDSLEREPQHPWFNEGHDELAAAMRDPRPALVGFCASLTAVDEGVERLVAVLDEAGVREETYVIFLSDNGFSCGQHGIWGKGNGTTPLNVWEDSIRVPFLVNRPGTVEPALDDEPTSATSLFETVLELSGVPAPEDRLRAGGSFADRLRAEGPVEPRAAAPIVIFDEYGGTRMIRTDGYKYVQRYSGPDELYDLESDPRERTSLIDDPASAAVLERMRAALERWFAEHTAPELGGYALPVSGEGQNAPLWAEVPGQDRFARREPVAR